MRPLLLLLIGSLLTSSEADYRLAVQETAVTTGRLGHYRYAANFLVERNDERMITGTYGIVIQKIDAAYRIEDAAGNDITATIRPRGRHDAYYEVFTLRPNGYSLEVDTFVDRIHPPATRGRILVWAAAQAWLPLGSHRDLQPHPDHNQLSIGLPPLIPFRARNRLTQAGDLPSTTIHGDLPFVPFSPRFVRLNLPSSNIIIRHCLVTWDGIDGDGQTHVERSTTSLAPANRWPWFWRKHVAPALDDPWLGQGPLLPPALVQR